VDISLLVITVIQTLVPWLTKAGDAVAQKAGESVWGFLLSKAKDSGKEKQYGGLLPLLKTHPSSPDLQVALKQILMEDLKQDPSFAEALSRFMQTSIHCDQRIWQVADSNNAENSYNNNQYNSHNQYGSNNQHNSHNQFFAHHDQHFIDHRTFNKSVRSEERCPFCNSLRTMKLSVRRDQVQKDRQIQAIRMAEKRETERQELNRKIRMSQVVIPSNHLNEGRYTRAEQIPYFYPNVLPQPSYTPPRQIDYTPPNPNIIDLPLKTPIHPKITPDFIVPADPKIKYVDPSYLNRINPPIQPLNFPISPPPDILLPRHEIPVVQPIFTSVAPLISDVKPKIEELTLEERLQREFEDKSLAQVAPRLKTPEDFGYHPRNFLAITSIGLFSIGLGIFWVVSNVSGNFLVAAFFFITGSLMALGWIKICRWWRRHEHEKRTICQDSAEHYNAISYPAEKAKWDNSYICRECGEIFEVKTEFSV
jgi:hypothetical protein